MNEQINSGSKQTTEWNSSDKMAEWLRKLMNQPVKEITRVTPYMRISDFQAKTLLYFRRHGKKPTPPNRLGKGSGIDSVLTIFNGFPGSRHTLKKIQTPRHLGFLREDRPAAVHLKRAGIIVPFFFNRSKVQRRKDPSKTKQKPLIVMVQ